jgi:VWFA-related protein
MPGRVLRAVVLVTALVFVFGGDPPQAARPGEKAALVTVVAEGGVPIRDLKPTDFIVKEDGKKRDVVSAQLSNDPLSIVLVIDTSQPPAGASRPPQDLRNAAGTFVKTVYAASPDTAVALVLCGGAAVTPVDFASKASDLDAAISRLFPDQQSSAVVLEALMDAAKKVAARPAPRRALVSIDFNSNEGSSDRMVQQAADSITTSGATFWAVSARGTGSAPPNREEVLNKMTKASGGKRFSSVDSVGLEGLLKNVAASLASQYVVTFNHPGDGPAKSTTFETVGGPKVLLTPFMR